MLEEGGLDALDLPDNVLDLILSRVRRARRRHRVGCWSPPPRSASGSAPPRWPGPAASTSASVLAVLRLAADRRLVTGAGGEYTFLHDRIREALLADLDDGRAADAAPADRRGARRDSTRPTRSTSTPSPATTTSAAPSSAPAAAYRSALAAGQLALAYHAPQQALEFMATAEAAAAARRRHARHRLPRDVRHRLRCGWVVSSAARAPPRRGAGRRDRADPPGHAARPDLRGPPQRLGGVGGARRRPTGRSPSSAVPLPRNPVALVLSTFLLVPRITGRAVARHRPRHGGRRGPRAVAHRGRRAGDRRPGGGRRPADAAGDLPGVPPVVPGQPDRSGVGVGTRPRAPRRRREDARPAPAADADVPAGRAYRCRGWPTRAWSRTWTGSTASSRRRYGSPRWITGDVMRRVLSEHGRWLDAQEHFTAAIVLCNRLTLEGNVVESLAWYERTRVRVSHADHGPGHHFLLVDAAIRAAIGPGAEADRQLASFREVPGRPAGQPAAEGPVPRHRTHVHRGAKPDSASRSSRWHGSSRRPS